MEVPDREKAAFLKEFGQRVESLIYQKYKSKDQFLRETGFYQKTLHDILTGTRDTHISTIQRLAKALGVKPRMLFPD
jgi:transcriptional regulator with XRE-family HTH domain